MNVYAVFFLCNMIVCTVNYRIARRFVFLSNGHTHSSCTVVSFVLVPFFCCWNSIFPCCEMLHVRLDRLILHIEFVKSSVLVRILVLMLWWTIPLLCSNLTPHPIHIGNTDQDCSLLYWIPKLHFVHIHVHVHNENAFVVSFVTPNPVW